ncbi:MAG TPA: hypothetical protein VHQ24_07630 [Lachnospiraceae bacterium]|nr:hypothetical protein [Lachnospiraceae bacterium]HEX3076715.1 hypothetical protein [Lachnospiraceae bacterium]
MSIKSSYHYQIKDHKNSIIIYYLILIGIMVLVFTGMGVSIAREDGTNVSGQIGGFEMSTVIFLFVTALCSFKESFGMLLQNGVSRKTLFTSRIAVTITIAAIMALIDKVILAIFSIFTNLVDNIDSSSIFEQLYMKKASEMNELQLNIESFIFGFLLYVCVMAGGYFITILFYRLGKTGKVIIGAGVPFTVFMLLPILDTAIFDGRITKAIGKLIDFALGFSNNSPTNAFITFLLGSVVVSAVSWLLMRKAVVKNS